MRRRVVGMAIAAVVAAALAACSSGGGNGAGPANSTSASGPGTQKVSVNKQLHASLPADVQKSGKLIMATDATIGAPFASFGPDNKTVVGLNVDMAKAIGDVLGVDVQVVNTPFGTFIPGLQAKRYDFSVSVMLDTKAREEIVDFIDYIKDGSGFLVRSDDPHDNLTLDDLCGMKAAAISGSVEADDLHTQSKKCTDGGKKPIDINIFAENAQGVLALASGRVDVWTGDSDQNAWLKKENNGKVKQSGVPFNAAIDGIALLKGNPLVPVMQKAVQELMDDGVYGKILSQYGIHDAAINEATLNNAQY